MRKEEKIFVAGHQGMIGAAMMRRLQKEGFTNLVTRTSSELNLLNQQDVAEFFQTEKPVYVFLAEARMGGIMANSRHPADFIYHNIQVETNILHSAWESGVKKLMFWGSNCIYPRESRQPIKEDYLLSGELEKTSQAYAVAKIAGITMCQAYASQYGARFISVIPANLYGPDDSFDPTESHVLSALIVRFHHAKMSGEKTMTIWGTGSPRREFFYIDDMADACLLLMKRYDEAKIINTGTGDDLSIKELAYMIKDIVGFKGDLTFDTTKPDGAPRKLLDSSRIKNMGWQPQVKLEDGIRRTYEWYKSNMKTGTRK